MIKNLASLNSNGVPSYLPKRTTSPGLISVTSLPTAMVVPISFFSWASPNMIPLSVVSFTIDSTIMF